MFQKISKAGLVGVGMMHSIAGVQAGQWMAVVDTYCRKNMGNMYKAKATKANCLAFAKEKGATCFEYQGSQDGDCYLMVDSTKCGMADCQGTKGTPVPISSVGDGDWFTAMEIVVVGVDKVTVANSEIRDNSCKPATHCSGHGTTSDADSTDGCKCTCTCGWTGSTCIGSICQTPSSTGRNCSTPNHWLIHVLNGSHARVIPGPIGAAPEDLECEITVEVYTQSNADVHINLDAPLGLWLESTSGKMVVLSDWKVTSGSEVTDIDSCFWSTQMTSKLKFKGEVLSQKKIKCEIYNLKVPMSFKFKDKSVDEVQDIFLTLTQDIDL